MLRTVNTLENYLTLGDVAKEDEVVNGGWSSEMNKNLSKLQKPKIHTILSNVDTKNMWFLILKANTALTQLRYAFTKAFILWFFDLKCHIRIETNASGYIMGRVLNQLILNSGQWYPMMHFLKKMMPAETRYKTYNGKFLANVKVFKILCYYLEGCKHEVFLVIDYYNLRQFIDTKNLSSY